MIFMHKIMADFDACIKCHMPYETVIKSQRVRHFLRWKWLVRRVSMQTARTFHAICICVWFESILMLTIAHCRRSAPTLDRYSAWIPLQFRWNHLCDSFSICSIVELGYCAKAAHLSIESRVSFGIFFFFSSEQPHSKMKNLIRNLTRTEFRFSTGTRFPISIARMSMTKEKKRALN